ncbi:hypothetical protein LBK6_00130 [Leptospira borgpetersenii serovar Hardjo]|nr:hypothetical protein LBK6_00130 [Leptospira borgpetersenii serovar Hardjo]AMX66581.1 hypothetical protein LBHA_00135 [Leptospira borgpetersenii serovar Hardjo]AMX69795.1 hypothetical protein LBHB_00125 [Leptospira borgpetersenii serovar Hardjo]AWV68799.1 hypothetical protein B9T54_00115 [Leptospira borgpetersenii serovar Hardjo-bovis]
MGPARWIDRFFEWKHNTFYHNQSHNYLDLFRQSSVKQARPLPRFGWRGEEAGRLGRFFPIRKSYFLQVKNIVLVGTLEKYAF